MKEDILEVLGFIAGLACMMALFFLKILME